MTNKQTINGTLPIEQKMLALAANAFLSMKDCYDPELAKAIAHAAFCFLTRKERVTVSIISHMTQVFPEFHKMFTEFLSFLQEQKKVHSKQVTDCTKLFLDALESSDMAAEVKGDLMLSFNSLLVDYEKFKMDKVCSVLNNCISMIAGCTVFIFAAKTCGSVETARIMESNKTARTRARWNAVTPPYKRHSVGNGRVR